MARDDPKTRYSLPPAPDIYQHVPNEAPWDTPISELYSFWLETRCECGRSAVLPLRLMAAEKGPITLRRAVDRLLCSKCAQPPASVAMVNDPAGSESASLADNRRKLVLVG